MCFSRRSCLEASGELSRTDMICPGEIRSKDCRPGISTRIINDRSGYHPFSGSRNAVSQGGSWCLLRCPIFSQQQRYRVYLGCSTWMTGASNVRDDLTEVSPIKIGTVEAGGSALSPCGRLSGNPTPQRRDQQRPRADRQSILICDLLAHTDDLFERSFTDPLSRNGGHSP